MAIPSINQFVRLREDDAAAQLQSGVIGVVRGYAFRNGRWGVEVDFYSWDSRQPVHRFEPLTALEIVDGPVPPDEERPYLNDG